MKKAFDGLTDYQREVFERFWEIKNKEQAGFFVEDIKQEMLLKNAEINAFLRKQSRLKILMDETIDRSYEIF